MLDAAMKTLAFVSVAFTVVTYCTATSVPTCASHSECSPGECCRVFYRGRKRSTWGTCFPLGNLGSVCHNDQIYVAPDITVSCSCRDGLECQGTGEYDPVNGQLGVCSERLCGVTADCNQDECCVEHSRPIPRRRRSTGRVCKPLTSAGEACLVSYGSGQPDGSVALYMSPCAAHLTCVYKGAHDAFLGPLGVCTA